MHYFYIHKIYDNDNERLDMTLMCVVLDAVL